MRTPKLLGPSLVWWSAVPVLVLGTLVALQQLGLFETPGVSVLFGAMSFGTLGLWLWRIERVFQMPDEPARTFSSSERRFATAAIALPMLAALLIDGAAVAAIAFAPEWYSSNIGPTWTIFLICLIANHRTAFAVSCGLLRRLTTAP